MALHELFGRLLALSASLVIAVSLPLAVGRVRPNRWLGFATRKTLASDMHWYAVNRRAGRLLLLWSLPLFGGGFYVWFAAPELTPVALAICTFAPLTYMIPFALGLIWALRSPKVG